MKNWTQVPSLNFRVPISLQMLIQKDYRSFQTCATRTTIPKEFRPRDTFEFDESYVIAYLQNIFSRINIQLDETALKAILSIAANSQSVVTAKLTDASIDDGYVDDFGYLYSIALEIIEYRAITENPESARNAKATKIVEAIARFVPTEIYTQAHDDRFKKKVERF